MKVKSTLKKLSTFNFQLSIQRGFTRYHTAPGFTLIELLIVIAILGVLAAGILVAIDPVEKINQANDSKVKNDISQAGRASEAYATTHGGFYPAALADLAPTELKVVPAPPTGAYTYKFTATPGSCTTGTTCTRVIVGGTLLSKVVTGKFWNYDSSTGKSCVAAAIDTGCP